MQDPLDDLLRRWRATPSPDPIAPEVWRRLENVAPASPPLGPLARLMADFARPAFAVAFMAACTLLGLFLAEIRLSRLQQEHNAQLAKSYLRLIDPLMVSDASRGVPAAPRS